MSIASEITRLNSAKSNLKTSIQSKGVTVPENAKLDSYSGYVDNITTPNLESKTVNPSTSQQTVSPGDGYNGLSSVTVNAVTAAIDPDIQAGNIKKDVNILGVVGTYDPSPTTYTITTTITNGSATKPNSIEPNISESNYTRTCQATITISANTGYDLPSSVSVTNSLSRNISLS